MWMDAFRSVVTTGTAQTASLGAWQGCVPRWCSCGEVRDAFSMDAWVCSYVESKIGEKAVDAKAMKCAIPDCNVAITPHVS